MKVKQKKNLFIILSYIMLGATIPITLIFSNMIGGHLTKHIQHTIENSAGLCAEIIEQQYNSDMLLMESLAMRMSTSLEENPDEGIERMISTAERYGMKRIAFSMPNGETLTTDHVEMDLTGVDNFERAMAGEILLTAVINDEAGGEEINVYSTPVYSARDHRILGVLSAVYNSEKFKELLSANAFEGEGYTYIIDSKGNVVLGTNHKNSIPNMNNLFGHIEKYPQNEEDVPVLKENLANGKSGFLELHNDDGGRFACYKPLNINDWYVVSVVPKEVAEVTKTTVMYSVFVYCICMSIVAIFVVLSIRHSQRDKNKLLEKALYEDELTGGITYAKFCIECRRRLDWRTDKRVACAFFNIDNFNLVSTLYGNEESDEIIRLIHDIIKDSIGEDGMVARNGTSQFVMMYFFTEIEEAQQRITQFNSVFYKNPKFKNMLRPSLGIYYVEDRDESVDVMINKAKIAHEIIKQNDQKQIAYYDENYRNVLYENRYFEKEMEAALENKEYVPYLQPKYNAANGQICGAEALIRWISSDGTIISPGKFIPLAENNGFIRLLDRAMFKMVCELQKDLLDNGFDPVPISVNVSRQLMYDKTFADDYYNLVQEMGLSTDMIELEITESAFFEDFKLFKTTLEKLRKYGFKILMDDFGTGYSSLMMLKSVPIDVIKLDKTFVDDYNDEKGRSIIGCVLELAKMLNIPVIAEGVETENQYEYLRQMGCDAIQGFYFSKPLPRAEYVEKLA